MFVVSGNTVGCALVHYTGKLNQHFPSRILFGMNYGNEFEFILGDLLFLYLIRFETFQHRDSPTRYKNEDEIDRREFNA